MILFIVFCQKSFRKIARRTACIESRRKKTAFNGIFSDIDEFGCFPRIAAEERCGNAEFSRLLHDKGAFRVIARREDHVRIARFDRRQLRGKILIAGIVIELCKNARFSGKFFKRVGKEFRKTDGIIVRNFTDKHRGFRVEIFIRVCRHNGSLKRIDKAYAEIIRIVLCNEGIRTRQSHSRNFRFLHDGTRCDGIARTPRTEHNLYFFFVNEALYRIRRFDFIGFVVGDHEFDFIFFPARRNRRIQFVCKTDAFELKGAARRIRSRHRFEYADFNRIAFRLSVFFRT